MYIEISFFIQGIENPSPIERLRSMFILVSVLFPSSYCMGKEQESFFLQNSVEPTDQRCVSDNCVDVFVGVQILSPQACSFFDLEESIPERSFERVGKGYNAFVDVEVAEHFVFSFLNFLVVQISLHIFKLLLPEGVVIVSVHLEPLLHQYCLVALFKPFVCYAEEFVKPDVVNKAQLTNNLLSFEHSKRRRFLLTILLLCAQHNIFKLNECWT